MKNMCLRFWCMVTVGIYFSQAVCVMKCNRHYCCSYGGVYLIMAVIQCEQKKPPCIAQACNVIPYQVFVT